MNNVFATKAFTNAIFRRHNPAQKPDEVKAGEVRVTVTAPEVTPDEDLCLVGSTERTGLWKPEKALRLNDAAFPQWSIDLPIDLQAFEYKFIVRNRKTGAVRWEEGDNRVFVPFDTDLSLRTPSFRWRGSGVAIPVFSLRSKDDFGAGDFSDLIPLVDWAVKTGQNVIQVLPVNDTTMSRTNADSYPYNANSTFALHPLYIRLSKVGKLKNEADRRRFERIRKKLNAEPTVNYEATTKAKEEYLRLLFEESGAETLESKDFAGFIADNASWLPAYAAWSVLRDEYGTPDYRQWGADSEFSQAKVVNLLLTRTKEMEFVMFVQYHLHLQLKEAHDYAAARGVALKGDIPIGISRVSADAWQFPKLFNLGMQAGAPPDDFAVMGQNWGFPTYNWERMAADGYLWWRRRLEKMAEYFDAYRIDHVLGFFRIWQIPTDKSHGLLGHFYPAMPLSRCEMKTAFGFDFNEAMLMPGTDTRGFATQREAEAAGDKDAEAAFDDVLFVADSARPDLYHPRISANKTSHYRNLTDEQRRAFDALYEDFYYRRHNEFWREKALQKLPPLIGATGMLACAEDLGMIPASVPQTLDELKVLTLEVQRMPKAFGHEFGHPASYPYLSVATTSTHDMCGLRGWLAEDTGRTQRLKIQEFADHEPQVAGDPSGKLCRRVVDIHLKSPSMLAIIPLQDYLATDEAARREDFAAEQINNPADPHHYWCYRMHLPIEKLPIADFSRIAEG